MSNMTNDPSFESSYVLLSESAKKIANFQKFKYLLRILVIKQKINQKKLLKLQKMIHFWIALDPANSNMQKLFKICKT